MVAGGKYINASTAGSFDNKLVTFKIKEADALIKEGHLKDAHNAIESLKAKLPDSQVHRAKMLRLRNEKIPILEAKLASLTNGLNEITETGEIRKRSYTSAVHGLQNDSDTLKTNTTRKCERVRAIRAEPGQLDPWQNTKRLHDTTRDREHDFSMTNKAYLELQNVVTMLREHKEHLQAENKRRIEECILEKDREIQTISMRHMKEREQLLEKVTNISQDIEAMEDHLRQGHYEDTAKKEQKLKDYRNRVQREYAITDGPGIFDEEKKKPHDFFKAQPATATGIIVREDRKQPLGLRFEDKTRLVSVEPESLADEAGFTKFIGNRVTHLNGVEVGPGQSLKMGGLEKVELRFDMNYEHMRCSTIKTDKDDPIKVFSSKREKFTETYKSMDEETLRLKERYKEEKLKLSEDTRKLKEYQQLIEKERNEKNREIVRLQQKVASTQQRQIEYEQDIEKIRAWMEIANKQLENVKANVSKTRKQIAGAQAAETQRITGYAEPLPEPEEVAQTDLQNDGIHSTQTTTVTKHYEPGVDDEEDDEETEDKEDY